MIYTIILRTIDSKCFNVYWEQFSKHSKLCLPTKLIQISKDERESLKTNLAANGVSNVRDQNLIYNRNFLKYGQFNLQI